MWVASIYSSMHTIKFDPLEQYPGLDIEGVGIRMTKRIENFIHRAEDATCLHLQDAQSTSVKTYGGVATSGTISGGNSTTFTIGKKTKVLSASVTSSPAAAPASSAAAAAAASSSKSTKPSKPTKHHKHA